VADGYRGGRGNDGAVAATMNIAKAEPIGPFVLLSLDKKQN
jgi:hypothetical protein